MSRLRWQLLCMAGIAATYVTSLFLPAIGDPLGGHPRTGWEVLGASRMLIPGPAALPALFALGQNLLLFLGVIMLGLCRNRTAMILGMLATLGASVDFFYLLWTHAYLYAGFFFWLASLVLLFISGVCLAPQAGEESTAVPFAPPLPDPSALALLNKNRQPQSPSAKKSTPAPPQGSGPLPTCDRPHNAPPLP